MSKKQRNIPQYSRPTKGYQQNMSRNMMKDKDIDMPKQMDAKKVTWFNRILLVVWAVAVVALWVTFGWKAGVACLVAGAIYAGGFVLYMRRYQKRVLTAYKKMGMTRAMYIKEVKRRYSEPKEVEQMIKNWDKINEAGDKSKDKDKSNDKGKK